MTFYKKRCVIVNSDEKLVAVCASLIELSEKFLCINTYTNCEEALQNLKKDLPDIVIMDVDYPQMKGPEIIELIKDFNPAIEIMIITDYEEDELVFNALSAGANGYILKHSFTPLLIESLSSIAKGQSPMSPSIARKLISNIQVNRTSPLTTRETEILKLITHGKSYSIIAAELGISQFTSRTHIKNIYKKLKVNSKSQAVRKALTEKLVTTHMMA
jgi:DNA-binding NarL/FixJ family response regulator